MRERTLACLVVAVAAFALPWQRCASDCHDRVIPAVGGHDCHDEPCSQDREAAAHERIEFLSRPAPAAPVLLAFALSAGELCAPDVPTLPARDPATVRTLPPVGEPPTATTVLLI